MMTKQGRRRAARRALLRAGAAALVLASAVAGIAPATASAAPGDLDVSIAFLDGQSPFAPLDELQASTSDAGNPSTYYFRYAVGYTCGPVACNGVTIHIDPQPLDPTYGQFRFGAFDDVTLPAGATIAGNATTGYTITLGDLPAGTSGSFQMVYRYQTRGVGADPLSFFPDGFVAEATATIDASNQDPQTATDTVTWRIETPDPRVLVTAPVARVGEPYDYTLYMSASCQWERSTAGHGEPARLCAREYEVTQQLPPGAVFQSASHGGVHDPVANTVTWTMGPGAGRYPAIGWGPLNVLGEPRTVSVVFPSSTVPDPGPCAIDVSTTLSVDMTYLDGEQRSATTSPSHVVNACPAFASAGIAGKGIPSGNAGSPGAPIVWEGTTNHYWQVEVHNRSNVPGVATIVEDDLDLDGLTVRGIWTDAGPATIHYELDDGTSDSVTGVSTWTAPAGRRIVAATVVTKPLIGPNVEESSQPNLTAARVRYFFDVEDEVPFEGYQRTNTVAATMSFPGSGLDDLDLGQRSTTVTVTPRPATLSTTLTRAVAGGGEPVAGVPVTFTATPSTSSVRDDVEIQPQYVFVAPYQWEISSASFPPGVGNGLPTGALPVVQVTIDGQVRDAVVVTGDAGWGANETWPSLQVVATPTSAAPAGSTGRADFFQGDALENFNANNAIWSAVRTVDAADLDGDGSTTESFARSWIDTRVGAASGLTVVKEVCQPDGDGGCIWSSDPSTPVEVAATADDIQYRVTVINGATIANGVVLYDVLPHEGDVTLLSGAPRGSVITESLGEITSASPGLTFAYSGSTDPCRPEIDPSGPAGCDPDWSAGAGGAAALRATLPSLGAGASVSFTYTAAIEGSPVDGGLACNTVAADSASTAPIETAAVCVLAEVVPVDPIPLGDPAIVGGLAACAGAAYVLYRRRPVLG